MDFHPHSEPCHRCHSTAWELVGEFHERGCEPEDVVCCAYCGLRVRVPAAVMPAPEPSGEVFRFQFGRFKGRTFAEADAEPNGRKYLEVMRDTNEKLRERITEYLLAHAAPSA